MEPEFADSTGRYQVEWLLGEGRTSQVYRAQDSATGNAVAIKTVRLSDLEKVKRLQHEIQVLERLEHPHVVSSMGWGSTPEHFYLALDFVEWGTLWKLLSLPDPIEFDWLVDMARQMCGAVAYIHSERIVHRDIKPDNVLIDLDGNLKLCDFDIARCERMLEEHGESVLGDPLVSHKEVQRGTAPYIAPEVMGQAPCEDNHLCDIYSLGVTLRQMFTAGRFRDRKKCQRMWNELRQSLDPDPVSRVDCVADLVSIIEDTCERL